MSLWQRIFSTGAGSGKSDGPDLSAHRAFIETLKQPAARIGTASVKKFSAIGGMPFMPAGLEWPRWKDRPLAFLCQLDLGELPPALPAELPRTGYLYFFYDQEQEAWGYDPHDRGAWRILFAQSLEGAREAPPPPGLSKKMIFPQKPAAVFPMDSYPPADDPRVEALNLSDKQIDEYCALRDGQFGRASQHQIAGYPSPVQSNDMDREVQLASHGVNAGDEKSRDSEQALALEAGRADWMLLLQLDSDDDANMMWGDGGMLYFWVRRQDAAAGRFDGVWMILQSH